MFFLEVAQLLIPQKRYLVSVRTILLELIRQKLIP